MPYMPHAYYHPCVSRHMSWRFHLLMLFYIAAKIVYLPTISGNLMQKRILFFLWMLLPVCGYAQFTDQFDDGDFTSNPAWVGDVEKFIIDDGMLRLNAQAAGQAYLATASSIVLNTQWDFWIRLAFTPSNNNHPRIYLVSDSQDLTGPLNGYYLRIGKDGGNNKRLYFYRQDGTTDTELMAGNTNLAATTNNRIRIRVTRDSEGNWAFFADQSGGHMPLPQGTAFDNHHTSASWFGVRCLYTVSNANRFYFDDFHVGEIVPDTIPPGVEMVQVTSSNTLRIFFSKLVEPASAQDVNNYLVDGGVGHPVIASVDQDNPSAVSLLFASHFDENRMLTISVSQVSDLAGNRLDDHVSTFVYYVPRRFDVVFNELMVDPTPAVGLPPYEFIELYNTADFAVNLEGWVFQHGNTRRTVPVASIPARGYLLLLTEAAYPSFQELANAVVVPGLSQTALTNAGADLLLFDPDDTLISFVSYTDAWYQDPSRSGGGWSLEKIDPYNLCQGMENWRASVGPNGGTPGSTNSVRAANPDITPPDLLRAGVENASAVRLYFSEPMDVHTLENTTHYTLNHGLGSPAKAEALLPDFSGVRLTFSQPLQASTVYAVSASDQLTDCAGNQLNKRTTRVGLPALAGAADVVINEVLFNPPEMGARYIELYNRSNKTIDLKDYLITSKDTLQGFLTTIQEISAESRLFFPDDYIVLSNNPDAVRRTFHTPDPGAFVRLGAMPRMTNASGVLAFATKSLEEIDKFVYEESMHLPLLTTFRGVALERLNPDWPTKDRSNWHSAARLTGYGTPGYKNSQYTQHIETASGQIDISPEVFSPDGDGQDDLLNISYRFDQPGFVANVRIFDSRGRMVRFLRQGELLATEGVITWDGTTDDNSKAPVGIYVIHLEVFDLAGNVNAFRRTAVVGGRL